MVEAAESEKIARPRGSIVKPREKATEVITRLFKKLESLAKFKKRNHKIAISLGERAKINLKKTMPK